MSEFWKSTPKYWCKYCSTYVKDTPLEKTNHEASPRHQGNLKKSLRDLHRSNEKAERDKQFAKAEAARLNGTGLSTTATDSGEGKFKTTVNFTKQASRAVSVDDRKRQMAQLAALGVAVPDSFRVENAMVGDWQTTSQKVIWDSNAGGEAEDEVDVKPGLNIGVRKPKLEEKEDDEVESVKLEEGRKRPRYGRDLRALPGEEDADEIDALLGSTSVNVKRQKIEAKDEVKKEDTVDQDLQSVAMPEIHSESDQPVIKSEDSTEIPPQESTPVVDTKQESEPAPSEDVGSIFKKRKRPGKPK